MVAFRSSRTEHTGGKVTHRKKGSVQELNTLEERQLSGGDPATGRQIF
jgi:hypothetical protein